MRYLLTRHGDVEVVNLDKLTYAGNLANLRDLEDDPRYSFVHGDICDARRRGATTLRGADAVVNFAAETHVDRSISDPQDFIRTDVLGTHTLLEAVRELGIGRYLQISTDEVYGSIDEGSFTEESPLVPVEPLLGEQGRRRPGGAVLRHHLRHAGPHHAQLQQLRPLPVSREDHPAVRHQRHRRPAAARLRRRPQRARLALRRRTIAPASTSCCARASAGQVYNIGGGHEVSNIELTREILRLLGKDESLIRWVTDRPGHDRRYSIDCAKLRALGWQPETTFEDGLADTVSWYGAREDWWRPIKSGEYREYYERQYQGLA